MTTPFNFIRAYETYSSGNEASPTFHRWAAYGTLSAIIGRRVWFNQIYYNVYPHLYIVFVGEPGDKKTTALNIASHFAAKAEVPMAPASITREAMAKFMDEKNDDSFTRQVITTANGQINNFTQLSFFASEIVTMLSAGGNPLGLIEFFTDIYDKDKYQVMTKNRGNDFIINPYVTILACMTPEQTGQMLKQAIITGGFNRRVIFVYGKSKATGIPFPELTDEQREAQKQIYNHIPLVKAWQGEFAFNSDAKDAFAAWYHKKHALLSNNPSMSAAQKNWVRSKDVLLIKLCMLDVISEFHPSFDRTVQLHNVQRCIKMLDGVEPDINRVFAGVGKHEGADIAGKILRAFEENPSTELTHKQMLARFYSDGNTRTIEEAIEHLVNTDRIAKQRNPDQPRIVTYRLIPL